MTPMLTEADIARLEQEGYGPLVELYRHHTPAKPKTKMLAVVHNLLFILSHADYIGEAIAFFNSFFTAQIPFSDIRKQQSFFTTEEDWSGGILKDDWQIPFQIAAVFLNDQVDAQEFFNSIRERTVLPLMTRYQQAVQSNRLLEFFNAFEFVGNRGCLPERLNDLIMTDWSMPPETNQIYISLWHLKSWAEIKSTQKERVEKDNNTIIRFAKRDVANVFINWMRNQTALRPLGVMNLEPRYVSSGCYEVTLRTKTYSKINSICETQTPRKPALALTLHKSPVGASASDSAEKDDISPPTGAKRKRM